MINGHTFKFVENFKCIKCGKNQLLVIQSCAFDKAPIELPSLVPVI